MVYVLGSNNKPLMPCENVVARLLLKENKARVVHRTPFTIKLNHEPATTYTQACIHGIDTGSDKIGSAVVTKSGRVIYTSEITVRNDISKKMTSRAGTRRNRRSRKTRYRAPRFLNRGNSTRTNRLAPTVTSKIDSHLKEIKFVKSLLPITNVIVEIASFDVHALKNPAVLTNSTLYQKGTNWGFANTKAYVLHRDNYTCQHCKGKSKVKKLNVHHLVYRSNSGSDDENNLIVLCKDCHDKVHSNEIILKKMGKKKGNLKHASQMNVIKSQLMKRLPHAIETFGYITKEKRQMLGLEKSHINDAIAIASTSTSIENISLPLIKKCISAGEFQLCKGIRGEQRIPVGKIQGFRKFDKVSYNGNEYFIKGRMTSGYAVLMGIDGEKIPLLPIPKLAKMTRVTGRKTWIVSQETIVNM